MASCRSERGCAATSTGPANFWTETGGKRLACLTTENQGGARSAHSFMRRSLFISKLALLALPAVLIGQPVKPAAPVTPATAALLARAKSLELPTPYVPPPGDPLEHDAAGFAKIMCSAVFITGLDPDFAAENVGYFIAPYESRAKLGKPVIDRANKAVQVTLPNGVVRTAKYFGDIGCIALPVGKTAPEFTPPVIKRLLPDASTQPWPMGDKLPNEPLPAAIDAAKLQKAVDAAFATPAGQTAAFVVTWKGRLLAERYGAGANAQTRLESWSMG